jgi:hypothetical protein
MPLMIGHAGDTSPTFASAEQFFIAHRVHTLQPPARRIETSIGKEPDRQGRGAEGRARQVQPRFRCSAAPSRTRSTRSRRCSAPAAPRRWPKSTKTRELLDMNPVDWGNGKPEPPGTTVQSEREGIRPMLNNLACQLAEVKFAGIRDRYVVFRLRRRVRQCRRYGDVIAPGAFKDTLARAKSTERLAGDAGAARIVPRRRR